MKRTLFYSFLLLSVLAFSCNKKTDDLQTTHAASTVKNPPAAYREGNLSQGDMHNIMVQAYIDAYGTSEFETMNKTNAATVAARLTDIAADNGFLDNTSAEEINSTLADGFINNDFFDATTGNLKSLDDIYQTSLASITNQDIIDAFDGIEALRNNTDADFLSKSNAILDNLKGLTDAESAMISGYKSTLNASYALWDRNLSEQAQDRPAQLMSLASADARGFHYGFWKTFAALGAAAEDYIDVCNMMGRIFAANFSNAYSGGAGVH